MASQVPWALAQDGLSSDQLRRMYDDAVVQLKTAQDRRNELARENKKLSDRIAQLEKELQQAQAANSVLADRTFQARSERAAFQEFLAVNPSIRLQWRLFSEKSPLVMPALGDLFGVDWPLPDKLRK